MQVETPSLTRIYRPRQLAAVIGISTATIWRLRQRGQFPAPIRISPGAIGWPEATILAWLESRTPRVVEAAR